jgi:ABC-type multidrug transport system fused ATPase/permease subunit
MPVLRSIDLRVEPGMKVAVPRFFDPSTGSVTIDGSISASSASKTPRRQIAMVLQPPLIFPISARDNLAYGRPDATSEEIRGDGTSRQHPLLDCVTAAGLRHGDR